VLSEDVTEKKKMQDALKESEELYRTLLNASPEAIIIVNTEQRIIEISDRTLDLFGIPDKEELINKDIVQIIPQSEVNKFQAMLNKTLLEGLVQNVEIVLKKYDETTISCELSTTLIQEVNGTPKAYMAILRDISERKEMERQLIRTERMVSLGEMASAMAHEINQPLLSISLGIDNFLMKVRQSNAIDEAYFTKKSSKIFDDVARISRLIDHVRTFSRDHDREKPIPIDVNESIHSAVSMISEQFNHHGIAITIECDPDLPVVMGNTYQFEQVVLNLLTNAKDALEERKNKTQQDFDMNIAVKTYHDERFNYVEVQDNGIGILPVDIDKIMLPFFTTKEIGKGTGLGLSISFGIVKEMGGTLHVESEPLVGTMFRVNLPIVPIQQEIQWMPH
jgi:PAS domain S-box-containing protein